MKKAYHIDVYTLVNQRVICDIFFKIVSWLQWYGYQCVMTDRSGYLILIFFTYSSLYGDSDLSKFFFRRDFLLRNTSRVGISSIMHIACDPIPEKSRTDNL